MEGHRTRIKLIVLFGAALFAATATPFAREAAAVPPSCTGNLVGNSSFETNTSGWEAYEGSILRTNAQAFAGIFSLKVTGPNSLIEFGVNDHPNWVASIPATNTQYCITAWVKGEPTGTLGTCRLRVREYVNKTRVRDRTYSPTLQLTPGWQQLSLNYLGQVAGASIDLQVLCKPAHTNEFFYLDAVMVSSTLVVNDKLPDLETSDQSVSFAASLVPNPLRGQGTMDLATTQSGPLRVQVFDLRGRLVRNLVEGTFAAGRHSVPFDGRDGRGERITPGVYFYRVQGMDGVRTGRFVMLRR